MLTFTMINIIFNREIQIRKILTEYIWREVNNDKLAGTWLKLRKQNAFGNFQEEWCSLNINYYHFCLPLFPWRFEKLAPTKDWRQMAVIAADEIGERRSLARALINGRRGWRGWSVGGAGCRCPLPNKQNYTCKSTDLRPLSRNARRLLIELIHSIFIRPKEHFRESVLMYLLIAVLIILTWSRVINQLCKIKFE